MCTINNEGLTAKIPRGNGTLTVNARDVAYVKLEHYPTAERIIALEGEVHVIEEELKQDNLPLHTTQELLRILHFKLEPKEHYVRVRCRLHELAPKPNPKDAPACRMLQIPINLNDATTGHKLQGLSKAL